jgi:hypothetical protein
MAKRESFTLTVTLTLARTDGPANEREEILSALLDEIDANAPQDVFVENDDGKESAYEIADWDVKG